LSRAARREGAGRVGPERDRSHLATAFMAIRGLATAGGRPSVAAARDGPDMMTRPTRFPRSLGLLAAVLLGVLPETVPAQTSAQAPAPAPVQAPVPAAAQAPPAASERIEQLPPVVVIDSTPVPGLGIPVEKYPGNVQSVPPGDIDNRNRLEAEVNALRFMERKGIGRTPKVVAVSPERRFALLNVPRELFNKGLRRADRRSHRQLQMLPLPQLCGE